MQLGHIHGVLIEKDFKTGLPEGLTLKTVRNILALLQKILNSAVDWGYLAKNPFQGSGKDKVRIPQMSREQKGWTLTPKEIRGLLDCCADDTHTIILMALLTGMRRGEILGLRWGDVDLDENTIHVKQALYYKRGSHWGEKVGFVFLQPKYNSIRQIDMSPELRGALREHWLSCHKENNPLDLVFTNSKGKPIEPDNFYKRRFLPVVKAANIGSLRLHDLRHTYGSLKIEQGENLKYVQQQMGHSSITVTVDVYAHLLRKGIPKPQQELMSWYSVKRVERSHVRLGDAGVRPFLCWALGQRKCLHGRQPRTPFLGLTVSHISCKTRFEIEGFSLRISG